MAVFMINKRTIFKISGLKHVTSSAKYIWFHRDLKNAYHFQQMFQLNDSKMP